MNLFNDYLRKQIPKQDQTGMYDYGFRQLDPVLGRWFCVDRMAESTPSESPYCYAGNDPINQIDVMGLYHGVDFSNFMGGSRIQGGGFGDGGGGGGMEGRGGGGGFCSPIFLNMCMGPSDGPSFEDWVASNTTTYIFSDKGGVYADKGDQPVIMQAIKDAFGETAGGFGFTKKKLGFSGTVNLGSTDILFWALMAAVYSEKKLTIEIGNEFVESTTMNQDPDTKKITYTYTYWNVKDKSGGGRTLFNDEHTKATMYIMGDAEYKSGGSDWGLDGKTFSQMNNHYSTQSTIFWHELGHFLETDPAYSVLIENEFRSRRGISLRAYDYYHPFNQNVADNWSYIIFRNLYKP
jgi:RHS repeat-associated protein